MPRIKTCIDFAEEAIENIIALYGLVNDEDTRYLNGEELKNIAEIMSKMVAFGLPDSDKLNKKIETELISRIGNQRVKAIDLRDEIKYLAIINLLENYKFCKL
ncbi:MAG: hypothetical protein PHW33_01745 [Candidatus Portnoybacteria bacterium]|jgi:hypothetical protein|nr:hypothetical protein [Candidatus Portnoybacteria bacterium]